MGAILVLGGGPNGLAAAVRLAKAGRKVTLVERRETLGGLSGAIEFHPGYRAPGLLHDEGLVATKWADKLDLAAHGLAFAEPPPVLLAEADGPGILLHRDPAGAAEELRRRSAADAEAYASYRAFLAGVAPLLARVLGSPPPPLSPHGLADYWAIARQALAMWHLGRKATLELLRVAPMCVADFLNERFATPLLVEGLAAPAVAGTWAGPWSAGTNTNLLMHETAPGRRVAGGPPALVAALERAARSAGVELRTGCAVRRILVERGAVSGVELADGATIAAPAVVSTADPKRTMLELLAPGTLPIQIEDEFRRIRMRGTTAAVHLALSAPLAVGARGGESFAAIRFGGGHVDALERAFDAVKYRRASESPHLEIRTPTLAAPDLAPPGHHVVSILASYVPYAIEGGWTDERRRAILDAVLARVEALDPALRSKLVAASALTPADIEREYALTGGQLHHGEPALDQLLVMRPAPSAARYLTPLPGLVLGGSGSHGGGGVHVAAGVLAAEALLAAGAAR